MLDQRYFNGIGNYLRAEILHRCRIHPFITAHHVLARVFEQPPIQAALTPPPAPKRAKTKRKQPTPQDVSIAPTIAEPSTNSTTTAPIDFFSECVQVMNESYAILLKDGFSSDADRASFSQWLQCYMKLDQRTDSIGRTIWYSSALPVPKGRVNTSPCCL
jgi:endonuclease VIII-like 1